MNADAVAVTAPQVVSASDCFASSAEPVSFMRGASPHERRGTWTWTLDEPRNQIIVSLPRSKTCRMTPDEARAGLEMPYDDFKRVHGSEWNRVIDYGVDDGLVTPPSACFRGCRAPPPLRPNRPETVAWMKRHDDVLMLPVREEKKWKEEQLARAAQLTTRQKRLALQAKCVELLANETNGEAEIVEVGDDVFVDGVIAVRLPVEEVRGIVAKVKRARAS